MTIKMTAMERPWLMIIPPSFCASEHSASLNEIDSQYDQGDQQQ